MVKCLGQGADLYIAQLMPVCVLSGLVAEMTQTTGEYGTRWISDLCNGIVKEDCIPEDRK